jgi:predicted TIM-barrel fold metal-dependent hydrolase
MSAGIRWVRVSCIVALALGLGPAGSGWAADPTSESRKLAAEVPIADLHLHLFPDLTPDALLARMDRNNVRWGGAVGPAGPRSDPRPFITALGKRYIPMAGQPEFFIAYREGGTAAISTADHPRLKSMLERAAAELQAGQIQGFGELVLNNRTSHPDPTFRRKAAVDSPLVRQMFEIAARHRGVVQVHIEPERDTVAELEAVMTAHPTVPVILSHCFAVNLDTAMAEYFLKKYAQALCDLSARSEPVLPPSLRARMIFGADFADPGWLRLMEARPDQFVIGSDATNAQIDYDRIIAVYRSGLLPRLSPATARKLAFENAVKLFKLE